MYMMTLQSRACTPSSTALGVQGHAAHLSFTQYSKMQGDEAEHKTSSATDCSDMHSSLSLLKPAALHSILLLCLVVRNVEVPQLVHTAAGNEVK